jgi:hypothetical protein
MRSGNPALHLQTMIEKLKILMKSLTGEKIVSERKWEWMGEKEFTGENFWEKEESENNRDLEV